MLPKVVMGTTTNPLGGLDKEPQSTATEKEILKHRMASYYVNWIDSRSQVGSMPVQALEPLRQNRVDVTDNS